MNWKKSHRVVALTITTPLLMIVLTGVVLQVRNSSEYLQPSLIENGNRPPSAIIPLEALLKKYGEKNIDQIIYRPKKNLILVRHHSGLELQLDPTSGAILKEGVRRTNFLIELHQGSWLGRVGQWGIHLLTGLGLLYLIGSGLVIYPRKRGR